MQEKLSPHLAIAILIFSIGCASPGSGVSDPTPATESGTALTTPNDSGEQILSIAGALAESFAAPLPQRGMLVVVVRWGEATFGVVDGSGKSLVPLTTKATGEPVVSSARSRLAYLVRDGPNPERNYVEVLDLTGRKGLRLKPAKDYAVLGFTLSPAGDRLSYAAMNLRKSRSTQVTWRVGAVDLVKHEGQISLKSNLTDIPEEGIPVPFGWSGRSGQIYLQGWIPFRGMMKQGIWAMDPDGSKLQKILPEPAYASVPRLSPDGAFLAYSVTDLESLPKDYVAAPGSPPGNVVAVMDLATQEKSVWARSTGGAFGLFSWSATGDGILASERVWSEGRFRDVSVRKINRKASVKIAELSPSDSGARIGSILECNDGSPFWVVQDHGRATLLGARGSVGTTLFAVPEGQIHLIRCLDR